MCGFGSSPPQGPILGLAPFVGYLTAGLWGAVAATVGVFIMPWGLAMGAARGLLVHLRNPRVQAFGKGAAPAIVSLFALAVLTIAHVPRGALSTARPVRASHRQQPSSGRSRHQVPCCRRS